ncbi:hypothetical protein D9M71_733470 [compost metagenome]
MRLRLALSKLAPVASISGRYAPSSRLLLNVLPFAVAACRRAPLRSASDKLLAEMSAALKLAPLALSFDN